MKAHESVSSFPAANAPATQHELHESAFGGGVEIIATPGNGPHIYYAHGAGYAQEEATVREITAQTGRGAFAMRFTGNRMPDHGYIVGHDVPHDADSIIPMQQAREAATLLGILAEQVEQYDTDGQGVDAIIQSKAAGHGIAAAYAQPNAFNSIVLAFPASVSGPQRGFIPHRVVRDGLMRLRHRPQPENDFRDRAASEGGMLHRLLQQVKTPGFWADAAALRHSALAPMLHSLRERKDAPGITILGGLDDRIFKPEDFLRSLVASTDIDQMIIIPGSHAIMGRKDVLATILHQFPFMTKLREIRRQARAEGRTMPVPPMRDRLHLPQDMPAWRKKRLYQLADALDERTSTMSR